MTRLIIGANGQVGYQLTKIAESGDKKTISLTKAQLDITSEKEVKSAFQRYQPTIVINAAAYTAVDMAEKNKTLAQAVNCSGVKHLAKSCQRKQVPLLHISTDFVFDGAKDKAYTPQDPTNPLSIYGQTKLAGEEVIRRNCERYIILRTSWVFGSHGDNFVHTILRLAIERHELKVVADQQGAPTSAASIAHCLLNICNAIEINGQIPWGTYHFSNTPCTTWHRFAEEIISQCRSAGLLKHEVKVQPISTAEYPTPAKRPRNSCLDMIDTQRLLGIKQTLWKDELVKVIHQLSSEPRYSCCI